MTGTQRPSLDDAFTHRKVKVNDVALHHVVGGEGPALLLLHGWPETWWEWRRVMPALAKRFSVIAADLRGFGDSDKPPAEAGYDVATLCADLAGLLDHLNMRRAHVAGHDLGGLVAYAFARLHADRVERLALMDAPLPLYGLQVPFWPEIEKQLWHQRFHRVPHLPEALISGRERLYLSWFFQSAYDPSAIGAEDIDEYVRAYSMPGALSSGFAFSRATEKSAAQVMAASNRPMDIPLLFLGGEMSLGTSFEPFLNQIALNAKTVTVPRSGHWMPEENPAFVSEQLLAFFSEEHGS
jgi:pimeloyl-ACP methyl ester carboxylesterase